MRVANHEVGTIRAALERRRRTSLVGKGCSTFSQKTLDAINALRVTRTEYNGTSIGTLSNYRSSTRIKAALSR